MQKEFHASSWNWQVVKKTKQKNLQSVSIFKLGYLNPLTGLDAQYLMYNWYHIQNISDMKIFQMQVARKMMIQ